MNITTSDIEQMAPNAAAAKNGRDLVAKNKFSNLNKSHDANLIWGECAGSGKTPYSCSADYMDASKPVFRCNCPSRQFPCKHAIGLLYAFEKGLPFTESEIPEDIASKRAKIEQREEKKTQVKETIKEKAEKPKKINTAAVIKKIESQLNGIHLAEKLLGNMVQMGLSSLDAKERKNLGVQIKELGNYYIGGIQIAFENILTELILVEKDHYTPVIDLINYTSTLLKKATSYLNARKENPELDPELDSAIEEQIGTVWKLTELMQYGLWEEHAELIQLSFYSYDDAGRKEYVDEGCWLNLKTGKIYKTKNYRPYKAAKYIKEENTVFSVLSVKELFVYPGDLNPRARWDASTSRDLTLDDLAKMGSYASSNYAELIKLAKGIMKNPLMDKNPIGLIALHKTTRNGNHLVVEDEYGNKLTLRDFSEDAVFVEENLKLILPSDCKGLVLLVMFDNDVELGLFSAKPLSLITSEKIVRLLY